MQYTEQTMKAHPMGQKMAGQMMEPIKSIADNAMTCHVCADACLHSDNVQELVQCIERNLECAASCEATVTMMLHPGSQNHEARLSQLDACASACAACAQECDKHAQMHEHCRICAEACRAAEQACNQLRDTVQQMGRQPAMV